MSLYQELANNNTTYQAEGLDFNIFPGPGFVENVIISSVTKELDKNQKPYLKFVFKQVDTDAELSLMEFAIEDSTGTATQDELVKKLKSQMTRLKHIITKFYGETLPAPYGTFEGIQNGITSFEDLINRIIPLLPPPVLASKKFRVFTHYNYKNYLELPKFVPFMEDVTIPKETSNFVSKIEKTLKQGTMYKMEKDKTTTDKPQDLLPPPNNDFQIPQTLTGGDLPF